jgi:hypothetical protein
VEQSIGGWLDFLAKLTVEGPLPPVNLVLRRLATGHRGVVPDAKFALDHSQGFSAAEDHFSLLVASPHSPRLEPVTKRLRINNVAVAADTDEQPADEAVVAAIAVDEGRYLNHVTALDLHFELPQRHNIVNKRQSENFFGPLHALDSAQRDRHGLSRHVDVITEAVLRLVQVVVVSISLQRRRQLPDVLLKLGRTVTMLAAELTREDWLHESKNKI